MSKIAKVSVSLVVLGLPWRSCSSRTAVLNDSVQTRMSKIAKVQDEQDRQGISLTTRVATRQLNVCVSVPCVCCEY